MRKEHVLKKIDQKSCIDAGFFRSAIGPYFGIRKGIEWFILK
ncbi:MULTISPECIES: hypothetical protein [Bacillus]|nr:MULTISPECIES: hypothetical protein [Bacillus]